MFVESILTDTGEPVVDSVSVSINQPTSLLVFSGVHPQRFYLFL